MTVTVSSIPKKCISYPVLSLQLSIFYRFFLSQETADIHYVPHGAEDIDCDGRSKPRKPSGNQVKTFKELIFVLMILRSFMNTIFLRFMNYFEATGNVKYEKPLVRKKSVTTDEDLTS